MFSAWVFPFLLGQRIKEERLAARGITLAVSRRESCLSVAGSSILNARLVVFVSEFLEFCCVGIAEKKKHGHDAGLRLVATR